MTAPAVVCWAAYQGWISLAGSPLSFMEHPVALVIFIILAVGELIADKLPKTPARTSAFPLIARIVLGGLCGAALAVAGHVALIAGVLLGAVGALVGTYGGYYYRHSTSGSGKVPDLPVALLEDLIAVGGGLLLVSRF
jgi:uncharacterized membrane protein